MDLKNYFDTADGTGVLSTSDSKGFVNAALYAKPHITKSGEASFIMTNKLSYRNVNDNPNAFFLFLESNKRNGLRIKLTKVGESKDKNLILPLVKRSNADKESLKHKDLSLVTFKIENISQL